MRQSPLPLFGIGNQGKSPNVDAQSRTNLYIEVQQDAEKHVLTMYPTPGLTTFVNFGETPIRGRYERGDLLYVVHKNTLYSIANDGTQTVRGTLVTYEGKVFFADNGTQIILTDGANGYIFNTSTLVFTKITAAGFPGAASVTFMSGRFVVNKPNSGQFYISTAYDGLLWAALDFATAEADPDNIVRVIADGGQLVLFGERTTEFWGDSGAQDFPFARIGSSAIEWGLAARDSLAKFMDAQGRATIENFRGKALSSVTDWQHLNLNHTEKASIDQGLCIQCGRCHVACEDTAHQAITAARDGRRWFEVIESECVGCNLCVEVCPVPQCISLQPLAAGSIDPRTGQPVQGSALPGTQHPNNTMRGA